ncbi:MAG: hypothetical protein E7568_04985 [Ruminococcaceae bacterium]|nr:hypothetical protein [Oscillospiraceae bacterium]
MFPITYEDQAAFEEFAQNNLIYKGAQYAFTFDERFWIYYYKQCDKYVYIALDSKTGLGSQFISTDIKYKRSEFGTLMPNILSSLKYLGEIKYLVNPLEYKN